MPVPRPKPASFVGAVEVTETAVVLPVRKPAFKAEQPVQVVQANVILPAPKPVFAQAAPSVPAVDKSIPEIKLAVHEESHLIGRLIDRFKESRRMGEAEAARYSRIFTLQGNGDFAGANAEIEALHDQRLMGHVLYQRYMSPAYSASGAELAEWLGRYADHPGAQKIYDLARRKGATALTAPKTGRGIPAYQDFDVGQTADTSRSSPEITKQAEAAQRLFYSGKPDQAYEAAAAISNSAGEAVPLAGWIAGLAAWKKGDYEDAMKHFVRVAKSKRSTPWMASAGAHWAARSALRARKPGEVGYWLARAAEHPRTFYGIISLKALGLEQARFNWEIPELTGRHVKALSAHPAGRRALALADAGNAAAAAAELRQMSPGSDVTLQEAMVALAGKAGVPDVMLRMGSAFRAASGGHYDSALYPDVPWRPGKGFEVDRALVYAFIRQESRFDPEAHNKSSGALGLMQLMPATAAHVAKRAGESYKDYLDPVANIDLGQKYLGLLLQDPAVSGNLFKLAVAYNAGPGKLARWEKEVSYKDDPLLFIESIPVAETRIFVERVLTNFWIYRIKYNQGSSSLEQVAEGGWPIYAARDIRRGSVFAEAATFFSR